MVKNLNLGNFWRFFANTSKSRIFFKNPALSLFYLRSPLTSFKKSEKSLELFLRKLCYQPTNQKNIKVPHFGLIWRPFCKYQQINIFFQISNSVTFLPLWSPNFIQKIRKILRAVSEKFALPTNQTTKYQSVWLWVNLETFSWITPNQEFFSKIRLCHFSTFIVP